MPRSGVNGTYTLPPNTDNQQPLTHISSSMFNAAMDDVEQTFNTPTPIAYGGTGAATAVDARAELGVDFYDGAMGLNAAQQGQARANIDAGLVAGFRNKIINGDFGICQRAASGTQGPAAGIYGPDRWWFRGGSLTGGTLGFSSERNASPWWGGNYLRITRTSATGAQHLMQRIENLRQFSRKKVTVTFRVENDAPEDMTIIVSAHYGTGGSPTGADTQTIALGTIPSGQQQVSRAIDLPDMISKTFGSNENNRLEVFIGFAGTNNTVLRLGRVSVVEGDATAEADPFSPRHIQQELALCQRYYQRHTVMVDTITAMQSFPYPTNLRASPTVSGGGAGFTMDASSSASVGLFYQSARGVQTLSFEAEL